MNNKMTAIAGIILKNERKNHKKINRKKYSINEIIKPDISTILPPNQKLICSNRTVIKIEKGITFNDIRIYQNLAKKYSREFEYDNKLDEAISKICFSFIHYLKGNKILYYEFETNFSILHSTNLLYYKEIYLMLNECYQFLILKRELNMKHFAILDQYYDLLSSELCIIFGFTLSMYQMNYKHDIHTLQVFLDSLKLKTSSDLGPLLKNVKMLWKLKSNVLKNVDTPYRELIAIYFSNDLSHIPNFHFNEWIDGSLYADIAFIATYKKQYALGLEYFRKAKSIHPCLIAPYLSAYYLSIKTQQPNLSQFESYLSQLEKSNCFLDHIDFYRKIIIKDKTIYKLINTKIIPNLLKSPRNRYNHFNLWFLVYIKKNKKEKQLSV